MGYITFDQLKSTVTKLKNYIDAKKATVTQTLTSGTEIGSVDGTKLYAPSGGGGGGSTVSVRQTITDGEEIGGISVDGVETKLYSNIEIEYIVGTQTASTSSWTGVTKDKTLKVGKIIAYKLPYASSSSASSLKLTFADGTQTEAIPLRRLGGSTVTTQFAVNNVLILVYDGTYWRVSAYHDTTYTPHGLGFGYATCATAEATVAKVASLTSYSLVKNGFVAVRFTYAVPANATLNINSRGAKPIWYDNVAITAGVIDAGDTVLFVYDGTHYRLVAKDKVGSGGSTVSVTQKETSGTNIADITVDGVTTPLYAPSGGGSGSTVSVTQKETTGTNIADITVDGVTTQLFAPSGGGGSTTLTRITTTAITLPQQQLKDDANNMQPVFLQITCDDTFTYACFGLCHAEIDNGVMLVYVHQLWGHAYKRVFGQSTGTLREILPLLTVPFSTNVENFTIPATLVSGDVYEVSGDATFKSQYIRGTYAYRESIVSLS